MNVSSTSSAHHIHHLHVSGALPPWPQLFCSAHVTLRNSSFACCTFTYDLKSRQRISGRVFPRAPEILTADIVNVVNIVNVQTYFVYVCYNAIFLLAEQQKVKGLSLMTVSSAQPEALLLVDP